MAGIIDKHGEIVGTSAEYDPISELKPVDVVPWSFLEWYADWFCAMGSFPEFIFEAKRFYLDSIRAKGWIEVIPAAAVRPVVRCKNCQYSREPDRHNVAENAACEGMLICCVDEQVYPPISNVVFVGREHFCGFGEARND